ncbi:Bax inhibitor 1 [Salvia divinorum]|uniref:Bax inhibitor 1 n=1 Tax=Salvia divinorum TaxID=28513 RepID=A0ABD1IJS1_SALDI
MDSFSSFFDSQFSSRNRWNSDSLKNFRQISPVVQTHLRQVYLSLCCALLASAVGVYLHIVWNVGGILTSLGCMGCIFWLLATPLHQEQKKVSLLMAAALLEGASIGPLIELAIKFDPSILVSAFVGCSLAFGCFSGAAMLARRREYLYLGGLLSSGLSILLWLHFASSIFGGSMALFKFELYFGLLVFVGYIVVDTQDIIEKAHMGDLDYVNHSLTLFTDFVAVFVRVLIIMLKNASEKEKKKKKRRN